MCLELQLSTPNPSSTLASISNRDEPALSFSGERGEWEPICLLAGAWGSQGRTATASKIKFLPRGWAGDIGRDARHTDCFIHVISTY